MSRQGSVSLQDPGVLSVCWAGPMRKSSPHCTLGGTQGLTRSTDTGLHPCVHSGSQILRRCSCPGLESPDGPKDRVVEGDDKTRVRAMGVTG